MNEKEKIKKYLEYKRISKNKFYVTTGFSIGFLDSGASLGADKNKTILDNYPDLNLRWLVLDEGDMILPPLLDHETNQNTSPKKVKRDSLEILHDLIRTKEELIKIQKTQIDLLEQKLKDLENVIVM